MELFRAAGVVPRIRALEMGDSHSYFEGGILRVDTFADIDRRGGAGVAVAGRPARSAPSG